MYVICFKLAYCHRRNIMANHQISLPKYYSDFLKELKKDFGTTASESVRRGLDLLKKELMREK